MARALARGFRPGDLALATAAPLKAWCSRGVDGSSRYRPPLPARQNAQAQRSQHAPQPPAPPADPGHPGADDVNRLGGARGGVPGVSAIGGDGRNGGAGGLVGSDVLLLGPAGRPRDLSALVAAMERLRQRPAGRGRVGCVLLAPSRERAEALQEAAFSLLAEAAETGRASMRVQAAHGGTRIRDDVSGLRAQPPELLIATPGRLIALLSSDQVKLVHLFESLRVLLLDGGEVLGEPGFRQQVERLLRLLPNTRLSLPGRPAGSAGHGASRRGAPPPSPHSTQGNLIAATQAVTLVAATTAPAPSYTTGPARATTGTATTVHATPAGTPRTTSAAAGMASPGVGSARPGTVGAAAAASAGMATAAIPEEPVGPEPTLLPPDLRSLVGVALRPGYLVARVGGTASAPLLAPPAAAIRVGGVPSGAAGHLDGTRRTCGGAATAATGDTHSLAAAVAEALQGSAETLSPADPDDLLETSATASCDTLESSLAPGPGQALGRLDAVAAAAAAAGAGTASGPPPLPLHAMAVPYEEHLPYLYVVLRQHVLSQARHKVVVQFPSASLARVYAALFQALGFPVAEAHSRKADAGRAAAVADFAAAPRGLLFTTDLGGTGQPGPEGLTLLVWVGLPRSTGQLVRQLASLQQAVAAAALTAATAAASPAPPSRPPMPRRTNDSPPSVQNAHVGVAPVAAPAGGGQGPSPSVTAPPPPAETLGAAGAAVVVPRCLLMLHDVERPAAAAAAVAEAMAAAGLGRVLPLQPGAWTGPLNAVQHRIGHAVHKVPPELKQRGLEGLLGHLATSEAPPPRFQPTAQSGVAGVSGTGIGAVGIRGIGGGGVGSGSIGGGGGRVLSSSGDRPQPLSERLGLWARRFAQVMGMPMPPQLSRAAARRMGLSSLPGVSLVDAPPPPRPAPKPEAKPPKPPKPQRRIKAKPASGAAAAAAAKTEREQQMRRRLVLRDTRPQSQGPQGPREPQGPQEPQEALQTQPRPQPVKGAPVKGRPRHRRSGTQAHDTPKSMP